MLGGAVRAEPVAPYRVVEDGIPVSLTGAPGDAARGRQIVVTRQVGLCVLCHMGSFPEERFQGTIGPNLDGVGSRLSAAQIRLRVVDAGRLNPDTVMPAYFRTEGLVRVGTAWRDKTVLSAAQIEDVVTFLSGLKEP
jgi:sulfur-oxidizing protein SoxX